LYMTKDLHQDGDKGWSAPYPNPEEEIPVGEIGVYGEGRDALIITYGNGYYYSRQAEKELSEKLGIKTQIIDLRWISPINWDAIVKVASLHRNILIVEECRKTGSLSEGLVAGLVERLSGPLPKIKVLAADDCFIPLGPAAAAGLPKKAEVIAAVLDLVKK
jgi:2-oxoisovalerate dehydrogenase E1 component